MEPFRCIIDKQLLKSFNLGQIKNSDFKYKDGKYQIEFENRQKYARIFLEAIMENKGEMFNYTRDFYRFFVVDGRDMPFFKIIK